MVVGNADDRQAAPAAPMAIAASADGSAENLVSIRDTLPRIEAMLDATGRK